LVEGPSDELIVQKLYKQAHGKLPLEAGIDVISVRALAFKRFLEISAALGIETHVITDNDRDIEALEIKYADFANIKHIHIHYDDDIAAPTLEPQLLKVDGREILNGIFGTAYSNDEDLLRYMCN